MCVTVAHIGASTFNGSDLLKKKKTLKFSRNFVLTFVTKIPSCNLSGFNLRLHVLPVHRVTTVSRRIFKELFKSIQSVSY